jgi:hypothetical protein
MANENKKSNDKSPKKSLWFSGDKEVKKTISELKNKSKKMIKENRLKEVLDCYLQIIEIRGADDLIYLKIVGLYIKLGEYENAKKYYSDRLYHTARWYDILWQIVLAGGSLGIAYLLDYVANWLPKTKLGTIQDSAHGFLTLIILTPALVAICYCLFSIYKVFPLLYLLLRKQTIKKQLINFYGRGERI